MIYHDTEMQEQLLMNFSSRTTSMDVQKSIESAVEKRSREVFGPPPGKKLIVFMDDMNMPVVDTYGTQQPIALLKLLFERSGFYDRGRDLNWKFIKDVCEYSLCQDLKNIIVSKGLYTLSCDKFTIQF